MKEDAASVSRFDRALGWALPAVAAATPFIVFFPVYPNEQQAAFFVLAMLASGFALGAAWLAGTRPAPRRLDAFGMATLAFAAAAAVSILLAPRPLFSLDKALLPAAALIFFIQIAMHPLRERILARSTAAMTAVGVLLAAYGIAQFFGFDFVRARGAVEKNAVFATIGHPNYLGSVLGPLVFMAIATAADCARAKASRAGGAFAALLMLACIWMARSRGVWLGLAAGFAWLAILTMLRRTLRSGRARRAIPAIGIGAAALAIAALCIAGRSARAAQAGERLLASNEVKSRLFYWSAAIDIGKGHPVFGAGPGMFDPGFWPYVLEQQRSPQGPYYRNLFPSIVNRTPDHAHNEYLELFADQGWAGLLLAFAWLARFLYFGSLAAIRAEGAESFRLRCAEGAFAVALVDAFFGYPWRLPVSLIVFMIVAATLDDGIRRQEGSLGAEGAAP